VQGAGYARKNTLAEKSEVARRRDNIISCTALAPIEGIIDQYSRICVRHVVIDAYSESPD
jgi:hypothetical protein